jgi:hypothetical protein
VLADNPLLAVLGRRGRGAVVEALRRGPARSWTVRDLARFADVDPMASSRAVRELAALGAVEVLRPGRSALVRWRPDSPAGRFLDALQAPDLRRGAAEAFASAYGRPPGVAAVLLWRDPADDPADPRAPARIALVARDPEAALELAGPALDAVARGGHPQVEATAWSPAALRGDDPVARAIRAGARLS